ncbi:MAG: hypothetical protein Q8R55_06300 [Candidatus Taylorbacteria bacterium]|nr:hypothetical protein [Candidatus Taylorbacteria bacterium]
MKISVFTLCLVSLFAVSSCSVKNKSQSSELRPIIQKVNWPGPSLIDNSALILLSQENKDKIYKSNVPVLFVKPTQSMQEPVFIVDTHYYAASFNFNNETYFSIMGTRIGYQRNKSMNPNFNCTVRGINGIVDENVGIWSITWSEYGASYALDIECSKQGNPHCSKDYIIRLANDLVYLGGTGS